VNFGHGVRHVANVLNDMRHVDTLKRIAVEGPGKFVEVPDDIAAIADERRCQWRRVRLYAYRSQRRE